MKLVRFAIISIIVLFLIITGVTSLIPSKIRISKAINLPNKPGAVLAILKDDARWIEWHPAFINDSIRKAAGLKVEFQAESDSVVEANVFQNGRPIHNGWQVYRSAAADSLTLQWFMDFALKWYPWEKFGSLFYENTYGVMMQQGLENLKTRINDSIPASK